MSAIMGQGGPQQGPMEPTDAPQKGQPGDSSSAKKITDQIMNSAPPDMRSKIERMVVAGRKIVYDQETAPMLMEQFQNMRGSDADRLAQGTAAIMGLIAENSKGPFPADAATPAAVVLMMDIGDFMEQAGVIDFNDQMIGEAVQELSGYMLKKLGIGPEELKMAQTGQGPQQPQPTQPPGIMGGQQ